MVDSNFLEFDCAAFTIGPSYTAAGLHNLLQNMLEYVEQLGTFPTLHDNTLDLMIANCPHLVSRIEYVHKKCWPF
ncbi:hypothetical protein ACOMHN_031612 [Nucella lapillus]